MPSIETPTIASRHPLSAHSKSSRLSLRGFKIIAPRFRSDQEALLTWLMAAHSRGGGCSRETMEGLFRRYGASPEQISRRGHELADFTHERWGEMSLFGGEPSSLRKKTDFFDQTVDTVFAGLYPPEAAAPENIIHVTCTGYSAPSGAQRLVSTRQWGERTQVLHAYHMGCYAAHPGLRMAAGLTSVDIVHTEMCSLHLDPTNHNPAQLVIQSLFADGFIKYEAGTSDGVGGAALDVLATRDIIVPNSTEAMHWATGPFVFEMTLSKEVPVLFASALPRLVESLFQEAGLDYAREKAAAVFAIHPGGPRIIELSERILNLRPDQATWSRHILREHGNMSSATLPHIWKAMLEDADIPDRSLIVSIGAGPGLTLSGALFRKLGGCEENGAAES